MSAKRTVHFILIILGLCFAIEASAQSKLYPKGRDNSKNSLTAYAARVDSLLLNNRKLDSFAFTIRPSFTGEQGCYYDHESSELVLKIANKCIWYSKNIEIKEYRCKISGKTANSINQLFSAAVFSSSYLAQPSGLDGETYEILINGGYYTAECWSPKKDTNCYKLVEILETLASATKVNDQTAIENITPKIAELTKEFESLFPEDVKNNRIYKRIRQTFSRGSKE